MGVNSNPLLPDLLCDFPLKSEIFCLTTHPREPVISIGLSKGHVTTLRLPHSAEWPEQSSVTTLSDLPSSDVQSSLCDPLHRKKKKRVSISSKILAATPSSDLPSLPPSRLKNVSRPKNLVDIMWQTRRHRISCRDLTFSVDGEVLFSGGGDSILKASNAETGKVVTKIFLPPPENSSSKSDVPVVLRTLSPQVLLVGTESTALHVLDLRCCPAGKPSSKRGDDSVTVFESLRLEATYYPHPNDFISSISLVPPSATSTSGFSKQWITSGGGTLALTDLRKGIVCQSDNHYRDFLSTLVINPKTGRSSSEKVIAAADFSTTVSIFNKNNLNVEAGSLKCLSLEESIDAMTISPSSFEAVSSSGDGDVIACAVSSGHVRFVATTPEARRMHGVSSNDPSIADFPHAELEAVNAIDFDVYGRMIVGGGHTVRVWSEKASDESAQLENNDGDSSDSDSRDGDSDSEAVESEVPNSERGAGGLVPSLKHGRGASTKLLLSDAWKFQGKRAEESCANSSLGLQGAVGDRNGPSRESAQDGYSSGEDEDFDSHQARKKRKHSGTNLPSRGASLSFAGLD